MIDEDVIKKSGEAIPEVSHDLGSIIYKKSLNRKLPINYKLKIRFSLIVTLFCLALVLPLVLVKKVTSSSVGSIDNPKNEEEDKNPYDPGKNDPGENNPGNNDPQKDNLLYKYVNLDKSVQEARKKRYNNNGNVFNSIYLDSLNNIKIDTANCDSTFKIDSELFNNREVYCEVTIKYNIDGLDDSKQVVRYGEYIFPLMNPYLRNKLKKASNLIFTGWEYNGKLYEYDEFMIFTDGLVIAHWANTSNFYDEENNIDYTYFINENKQAVIVEALINSSLEKLEVVNTINGYSVTSIYANAFTGGSTVNELIIPDSIEKIFNGAFSDFLNLSRLKLGKNLSYFYPLAFGTLKNLVYIDTSESLYFEGANFTIMEKTTKTVIRGFNKIEIPSNAKAIGEYAYSGLSGDNDLIIENNLTIKTNAFSYATNIDSIVIKSENTIKIEKDAFVNCSQIKNLYIACKNIEILDENIKKEVVDLTVQTDDLLNCIDFNSFLNLRRIAILSYNDVILNNKKELLNNYEIFIEKMKEGILLSTDVNYRNDFEINNYHIIIK